jgi:hypothetical protein
MKKLSLILALALIATGLSFAQSAAQATVTAAPTITVEGKLALINGQIGIKSGSKTYYVSNLGRLVGFVDGVKEGATVKVEGYEFPLAQAPEYSHVRVTKLTVGGKDYDLSQTLGKGMGMMGNNFEGHGDKNGKRR